MPRMDCLWLCAMCSRKPWLLQMATFQIPFRLGEVTKQCPCWWFFGWSFDLGCGILRVFVIFLLDRLAQAFLVKPDEDAPAWCNRTTKDQLNPHWDKTHFQIVACEGGTVHFPVARPRFAAWTASQHLKCSRRLQFVLCFLNHSKIRSPSPFTPHNS